MSRSPDEELLRALFRAAVRAADPEVVLAPWLPAPPAGRLVVVGAGKAAAAMARVVERHYDRPLEGVVAVPYAHAVACSWVTVLEAAHPVPDDAGVAASTATLELVGGLGPDDLVLALVSGGGSALLTAPRRGISLAEKASVTRQLLRSGAPIGEINVVRKHLSGVKGGRLAAAAHPARVVGLIVSDVPGDDPALVASGPTVGDQSQAEDALDLLVRHGVEVSSAVRSTIVSKEGGPVAPDDPRLATTSNVVVASAQAALEAAAALAMDHGVTPVILGNAIQGEARHVGTVLAGMALQARSHGQPAGPSCVLLSGGETTVTVTGDGRGGRNVELLASMALTLDGAPGIHALCADTDGIDGAEPVAGGVIDPTTPSRAVAAGLDLRAVLDEQDTHRLFRELGDQVITGPTLTNVNDFRAVLVR